MQGNLVILTEDQKSIWAEAGTTFPGKQLELVVDRAIADFSTMKRPSEHPSYLPTDYYEIRRWDTPNGFDSLLKLQDNGRAKRYTEMDENGAREVLQIEVTLFDMIMAALKMLLDVFFRLLGGALKNSGHSEANIYYESPKPTQEARDRSKYVPTWRSHLIKHDEPTPFS